MTDPAGTGYYDGGYDYFGYYAYFWSSTEYDSGSAWLRYLCYYSADVARYGNYRSNGFSVRCVRD